MESKSGERRYWVCGPRVRVSTLHAFRARLFLRDPNDCFAVYFIIGVSFRMPFLMECPDSDSMVVITSALLAEERGSSPCR